MTSRKRSSARLADGFVHAAEPGIEAPSSPEPSAFESEAAFEAAPATESDVTFEAASALEPAPVIEEGPGAEHAPVFEPDPIVEPVTEMGVGAVMEDAPIVEPALDVNFTPAPTFTPEAEIPAPVEIVEAPMASMTEAQSAMRSMVETGLTQTHSKFSQMKSAADGAAHAFETSYATVKTGVAQINVAALEALSVAAEANFAFFKSAIAVKSPADYVALQSEFARKQIETMTAHGKSLGELAQKVAADSVEPIKAQVAKSFQNR